eukprot:jgi/Botrbrau1/16609/Bobra.0068s0036.1
MTLVRGSIAQQRCCASSSLFSLTSFTVRCSGTAPQPNETRRLAGTKFYKKGLVIPQRLTWSGIDQEIQDKASCPQTVYTIRFQTDKGRASGLTEAYDGVMVCLISQDGTAVLRRVSPLNDPEVTEKEVFEICSVVDKSTGADCSKVKTLEAHIRPPPPVKLRFQPGSIDEVSFLAPELGPLASIMIGPENGSWHPAEVMVSSSRTGHSDRFVCRDSQGPATYLSPVPPGSVVIGSGESATILTKEQATTLHSLWMMDYRELKDRLMLATSGLVIAGAGIAFTVGGWDAAAPFLAGGVGGLFYCWLLQQNVDAIPAPGVYSPALRDWAAQQGGDAFQRVVGSSAFRFALLTAMALGSVWAVQLYPPEDTELGKLLEVRQVLTGILGFLMWKLALVGVTTVPVASREAAPSEKKSPY